MTAKDIKLQDTFLNLSIAGGECASLAMAIHDAMVYSPNAHSDYVPGLHALMKLMKDHVDKLDTLAKGEAVQA